MITFKGAINLNFSNLRDITCNITAIRRPEVKASSALLVFIRAYPFFPRVIATSTAAILQLINKFAAAAIIHM